MNNKIFILTPCLFLTVSLHAQHSMLVNQSDGIIHEYKIDEVEKIFIEDSETFFPFSGIAGGYEYVDLGLPSGLKWAIKNIGADKPYEYGIPFAWGKIETDEYFSSFVTDFTDLSELEMVEQGLVDTLGNLSSSLDAVVKNRNSDLYSYWRMPTREEFNELKDNCTWTWVTISNIDGYKVQSNAEGNDNWLFIPAAGYHRDYDYVNENKHGSYWSSTVFDSELSYCLSFSSKEVNMSISYQYLGYYLRAVVNLK